jgi:hypothetical protein
MKDFLTAKVVKLMRSFAIVNKDHFAKYEARKEKTNRDFLTAEELQLIEEKQFNINRLDAVRDTFFFSCYTGLAYSDIKYLKPDNIRRGIDGEYWFLPTGVKPIFLPTYHYCLRPFKLLKNTGIIRKPSTKVLYYLCFLTRDSTLI